MPREYRMTWKGGSVAASAPVGRGYLLWEGGLSHSNHGCLGPGCSGLSIPWGEGKEKGCFLTCGSGKLEGSERSRRVSAPG